MALATAPGTSAVLSVPGRFWTWTAVDATGTFSRPGPRLVDGLELLAHVLHPDRVPEAPTPALDVDL